MNELLSGPREEFRSSIDFPQIAIDCLNDSANNYVNHTQSLDREDIVEKQRDLTLALISAGAIANAAQYSSPSAAQLANILNIQIERIVKNGELSPIPQITEEEIVNTHKLAYSGNFLHPAKGFIVPLSKVSYLEQLELIRSGKLVIEHRIGKVKI